MHCTMSNTLSQYLVTIFWYTLMLLTFLWHITWMLIHYWILIIKINNHYLETIILTHTLIHNSKQEHYNIINCNRKIKTIAWLYLNFRPNLYHITHELVKHGAHKYKSIGHEITILNENYIILNNNYKNWKWNSL